MTEQASQIVKVVKQTFPSPSDSDGRVDGDGCYCVGGAFTLFVQGRSEPESDWMANFPWGSDIFVAILEHVGVPVEDGLIDELPGLDDTRIDERYNCAVEQIGEPLAEIYDKAWAVVNFNDIEDFDHAWQCLEDALQMALEVKHNASE